MDFSADKVCEAVGVLLHNPDPNAKQQASQWLEELQKSVHAWSISDQILHQNISPEVCTFAAQTMRGKIKNSFYELPEDSYMALRDSLLQHMDKYSNGPAAVTTQLVVALADLIAYVAKWEDPVGDLLGLFGQRRDTLACLLEVLQVLPEEVQSEALRISNRRVYAMLEHMRSHGAQIEGLLATLMQEPGLQERVLKCFSSCVRFGTFDDDLLAQSRLTSALFDALRADHLFDSACDAICSTIYVSNDPRRYGKTMQLMTTRVMALQPSYTAAMQAEDLDKGHSLVRVFAELGESYMELVLDSPDGVAVVDVLLRCTEHPEVRSSEMTFHFWYDLVKRLRKNHHEEGTHYNGPLKDHFHQLVVVLWRHMHYPELMERAEVLDPNDDFYHFRTNAAHLVYKIGDLLGPQDVLHLLHTQAQGLMMPGAIQADADWKGLEAYITLMAAVADKIPPAENAVVPALMSHAHMLSTAPETAMAIRQACLLLIGNLARWIEGHPDYLPTLLQLCCAALQVPEIAGQAARAISNLAGRCPDKMAVHIDLLLTAMQYINQYKLSKDEANEMYQSMAQIISCLPHNMVPAKLGVLMTPVVQLLETMMTGAQSGTNMPAHIGYVLDRITFVFKHLTFTTPAPGATHPCYQTVSQLWPILERVFAAYESQEFAIEKWCRCMKAILLCLDKAAIELLLPLVTLIVGAYQRYLHSPLPYMGCQIVRLFGSDPSCESGLQNMLAAFCQPTFALLNDNSRGDPYINHADIVEDFFRLMCEFVRQMPLFFLATDAALNAFLAAINGLRIYNRDALLAMTWYLRDVLGAALNASGPSKETVCVYVHRILAAHGSSLVFAVIGCIGGAVPIQRLEDIAHVAWDLVSVSQQGHAVQGGVTKEMVYSWAAAVLAAVPDEVLPQSAQQEFLIDMFSAKDEKHMDDAVYDLAHKFTGRNKIIA